MLKHIVLFRLKPSSEGASKEENAQRMKREIEAAVSSKKADYLDDLTAMF